MRPMSFCWWWIPSFTCFLLTSLGAQQSISNWLNFYGFDTRFTLLYSIHLRLCLAAIGLWMNSKAPPSAHSCLFQGLNTSDLIMVIILLCTSPVDTNASSNNQHWFLPSVLLLFSDQHWLRIGDAIDIYIDVDIAGLSWRKTPKQSATKKV